MNHLNTNEINVELDYRIIPHEVKLNDVIFVFINPRSGAEEGKIVFDIVKKNNSEKNDENLFKFLYSEKDGEMKFAYIFNIIDKDHYLKGCELLRSFLMNSKGKLSIKILNI
jgi:hypothetical protein